MYTINIITDSCTSVIINGTEDVTIKIIEECTPLLDDIVAVWNEIRLLHPSYENYKQHCQLMNDYTRHVLDLFKELDRHGLSCNIDYDTGEDMKLSIW